MAVIVCGVYLSTSIKEGLHDFYMTKAGCHNQSGMTKALIVDVNIRAIVQYSHHGR